MDTNCDKGTIDFKQKNMTNSKIQFTVKNIISSVNQTESPDTKSLTFNFY